MLWLSVTCGESGAHMPRLTNMEGRNTRNPKHTLAKCRDNDNKNKKKNKDNDSNNDNDNNNNNDDDHNNNNSNDNNNNSNNNNNCISRAPFHVKHAQMR